MNVNFPIVSEWQLKVYDKNKTPNTSISLWAYQDVATYFYHHPPPFLPPHDWMTQGREGILRQVHKRLAWSSENFCRIRTRRTTFWWQGTSTNKGAGISFPGWAWAWWCATMSILFDQVEKEMRARKRKEQSEDSAAKLPQPPPRGRWLPAFSIGLWHNTRKCVLITRSLKGIDRERDLRGLWKYWKRTFILWRTSKYRDLIPGASWCLPSDNPSLQPPFLWYCSSCLISLFVFKIHCW